MFFRLRRMQKQFLFCFLIFVFTFFTSGVSRVLASEEESPPEQASSGETVSGSGSEHPENAPGVLGDSPDDIESSTEMTDERLESLITQLQGSLPAGNGSWAVYIIDLVKGSESGINDTRMQAASLIKLYIMGAVYENYDSLISENGQDSIDSWLYSMITVSDNDAANALVGCLGKGDSAAGMMVVNDYCLNHGYYQSSMGRLLLHSNEFGDNYTSVSDCAHFLQTVYEGDDPHADSMYSLLKAQTRRNKIPAQMPPEVSVANKTGELSDVENDAGILYDTANDLVIVFMSENLSDVGSAQSAIASLSRQIYDAYCQPDSGQ